MVAGPKTCKVCGESKALEDYYAQKATKDGRAGICKECHKARMRVVCASPKGKKRDRARFYNNPKRRAYSLKQSSDWARDNRERSNALKRKSNAKYPEKRQASLDVNNAVRKGTLVKPEACTECGITDVRIHGHHEDYSKPLEVDWLCPACHGLRHRKDA